MLLFRNFVLVVIFKCNNSGTPVGSVATVLERRVAMLENENQFLRTETSRIAEDVEKTEAEEKYLVEDAIKRLGKSPRSSKK